MAKKNISTGLETALVANEPFEYAHLVKFERPFISNKGAFRTNANRYVYITDAQRDITYDGNIYRAHGVLNVGAFSETTQARATNMTLSLSGEQIGTEITATGTFTTSGVFNATTTVIDGEVLDFVELGFREGDLIEVKRFNDLNFSDGSTQKRFVISSFSNNNQSITFARTGTDTDDSAFLGTELSSSTLIFSLVNQEYRAPFLEKGTTATNSSAVSNSQTITLTASNSKIHIGQLVSGKGIPDETIVTSINGTTLKVNQSVTLLAATSLTFTSPSFINREVFIHKAFINPETGEFFGTPLLNFKGIISSVNIQENSQASRVQWSLTSHWGDFDAVTGRLGTDEIHRSLDANGISNPNLTIRPEYAGDLGFLHAETSLNTLAVYQTTETRTKIKSKKRGGLAGLFGAKKFYTEEYQVQVDNEVDLSVYLQGRYIPVVYGVQRIAGVPVFADTLNNNSKVVYVAYTLAEGEIHGIYNMYIDGAPLICVDKNDADVRSTTATNSDSQALQCYGRMDRGDTLGGVNANQSAANEQYQQCADIHEELAREDIEYVSAGQIISNCYEQVTRTVNSSDLSALYANETAEGLQHEESAKISHPFAMEVEFHSGRPNQLANNLLATQAASNNFKRQNDYYSGTDPYWGPNHRLLDTAYAVMKFTIEADQTTIPEVEYVVKGKVLENYNFDGTFIPNPSASSNDHTNFSEGDTVTVSVSSDGSSWGSDGNGNYRILDKYQFTTSRGTTHYRFRLDKIPVTGDNTYVKLVKGSDEWEMITYDHAIALGGDTIPSQVIETSSIQTNSSGVLTATLTSAGQTKLTSLYGSEATSSTSTSRIFLKFIGATGAYGALENATLQATYSGNTLTFPTTSFSANQTLSGITIVPDRYLDLSNDLGTLSDTLVEGTIFKNLDTGEEKEIVDYNTTTKVIKLESGFAKTPLTTHNYTIKGAGKDLRASTNPAIQTIDLLTNSRYGKGLELADIDLTSVKQAARVCDTRSDITIPLATAATCVEGDIYTLEDGSGNHVASGKVKTSTTSESSVTLTDVSGKFSRVYKNYITYIVGDIVTNIVNDSTIYYKVTSSNNSTGANRGVAPTHSSGTVGGFEVISSAITLTKSSGSGPASLSLAVDGRIIKYSLYDADFVKYWRYLGWEENRQWCVTRHQTNFIFATERSIFENINALLSHYNGILSYSNGKYVLDVETAETTPTTSNTFNSVTYDWNVNPEYIDNTDIIGGITVNDNAQRNAKNTIKASISDPQNNFSSRSVSFFNSDFLKADRGKIKTGNYPVTGITSYYNARIGIEKELIQSRYSKEISFTVGQKGLLLKPGAVIAVTYDPFEFSSKLFRIENLTHNANCTTSIKAREYSDEIYAVTPQIANKSQEATTTGDYGLALPGTPASLSTTTTKPGVITLSWNNASDYKEVIDSTEIWRANTQGSSGDITSHATLVTVVDNATTFSDALGEPGTFYYWIRHRRMSRRTSDNAAVKLVGSFSTAITAGVSGTAKVLSPQLDVDVSSIQIKFNDSGALTPSGTAQDVKLTATLRNITPNASGVVFTLVDADQTSQTDVQFTNGSTTLTDTSSPYEATVDASSASNATTNKFVKVTTTDTGGEVFTELVPISITKDGSSGSTGIAAAAVKVEPSTSVITYSANDPDNEDPTTTITFTTELQGNTGDSTSAFSGSPFYEFLVDGTTVGSILSSGNRTIDSTSYAYNQFALPEANEPADGETVEVKVKVRDGSTTGTVKATDSVTIFGIKSGSDAITAFLTNSSHVVSADSSGTVSSFTGAGGTFKVFVGSTDRTTSCTFSEVANAETSGLTSAINSSTGVYEVTALSVDLAQNTFRATIPASISPTGVETTIDQTYSISKSKQGTAGAGGANAKTVRLTAADYSIVYDEDGANPSPSGTITLTATAQNFSGTNQANARFRFTGDGITDETSYTAGTNGTDTFSFTVPTSHFTSSKTLRVGVAEASASTTEVAFDTIDIFAVKSGANAYTVILDNEAHAIPADKDGNNAVMTGSGCTISVFKGSSELNGIATGTPGTSQFKVTVSSDDNITASSTNGTSGGTIQSPTPVVFADHSSLTAATANIIYSIDIEGTQTVLKKQSFTRVDKGDTGSDAAGLTVSSNIQTFSFDNSADTTPTPTTATITVNQQNQATNLVTGDITVTNGTKSNFSYSGSNGTGTATVTVTPTGTYPITVSVSNDSLTDSLQIAKVTGGDDGNNDPRSAVTFIFNTSTASTITAPTDTTSGTPYNFETGVLTIGSGGSSGWQTGRPASFPYWQAEVRIKETTAYEGSQTVDYQTPRRLGKIGIRDEGDFRIQMASDLSKFEYSFDAGSNFDDGASIPTGVKNTSIDIDSSTGQISGIGTGNNSRVFNDVIGISLDTTTNVGRLTISGVGTSNTTADITKSNLALDYDDGATVGARLGTNLKTADGLTTLGDDDVKNASITLESDGSLANIGTTQVLSNSKISINSSNGQISGIGTGNNSRVFNDVIGISLDTTTNVGRLTISGVGASNTTADITKTNLGLQYDDGATVGATLGSTGNLLREDGSTKATDADVITSQGTANNVSNVGTQTVANAQTAVIAANLGLTSAGVVNQLVPKAKGGFAEDVSSKSGVVDFSSGTANFRTTLPTNRGGFGLDVGTLFGSNVGRFPRWNGSAFTSVADNDYINSGTWTGSFSDGSTTRTVGNFFTAINSSGQIVGDIFDGTNTRSAGNITGAIDSSGRIVGDLFDGTNTRGLDKITGAIASDGAIIGSKLPIDGSTIDLDGGNLILKDEAVGASKLATSIAYTGTITAGSGTNLAGITGRNAANTGAGSADSDTRIFAGDTFANRATAPFRVTQGGALSATSTTLGSTSGIALDVSSGTKHVQINTPSSSGLVFQAGGDASTSYIPFKITTDGTNSTGVLKAFDIYTSDGTKIFDKDTGLTDAAITTVAAATGSAVSTVSKTTTSENADDAQKITNGASSQTVTVKAFKDGTGMIGFDTGSLSNAIADIPSQIVFTLKKSANADLSSPTTLVTKTINRGATTSNAGGTDNATTFIVTTEVESEPGFSMFFASVEGTHNDVVFNSDGDLELSATDSLSADQTVYYFTTISGTGGNGAGSNNRTSTASRTLTVTAASGNTFTIDESGDSTGSTAEGDITEVVAGSGMTGGATSGSATLNVIGGDGITANADDIAVDSTVIRTTGNQTLGGTKTFSSTISGSISGNAATATTATNAQGLTGSPNITVGTISSGQIDSSGRIKATNWIELESSGASLSAEEAGLRWDYNDSPLWYFYKDNANDGALHIQSAAASGEADATPRVRFHRTARETYFGGSVGINQYSITSGNSLDVNGNARIVGDISVSSTGGDNDPLLSLVGSASSTFNWATEAIYANLTANEHVVMIMGKARSTKNAAYVGYKYSGTAGSNSNYLTFGHYAADDLMYLSGDGNLSVNSGNITATGSISTGGFTIPATTGTSGQVLKWPSSGTTLVWSDDSGGGSGLPSGMTYSSSILDVTGTIRATADVIAYHSSDYRLKDNVKEIDNALEKVSQIRGVEFDWNEKQTVYEGHDIGVIAQEVEKVAPEIVVTRDDGYKAVNYQKLTALLIEAVKELKEEIKELKKDK